MCQHWAEHGFAGPWGVWLLYAVKLAGYLAGGLAFVRATPGIGPLSAVATWWSEPVVFQKALVWSLLFEVIGLGGGFGPLTGRLWPPLGGALHWLRPGTVRLPPWPDRVPLTRGTTRTPLDALLYLALLVAGFWLLASPAGHVDGGVTGSALTLAPARIVPLAVLLPLLGLRDKTIFLAARAEHYWLTLLTFFLPLADMVVTAEVLLVLIWWGAATATLSRVSPFTLTAMLSNAPLTPKWIRRRLFRGYPEDLLPSRLPRALTWLVVCLEYLCPLLLLVSSNPAVTLAVLGVLAAFHLVIVLSVPVGVPLEWNLFIVFAAGWLFWAHASVGLDAADALVPTMAVVALVGLATWGNLRPDHVSYLWSLRFYAGNWPTSMWAMRPSAVVKINERVPKGAAFPKEQARRLYGEQVAEVLMHKVYTFRSVHHDGRALFGLLPRAGGPDHEDSVVLEGELVAGIVLGWNFGDGHLHNEQLLAALHERCRFEPGEVRAVILESAPLGSQRQEYRLVDAAAGEFERGYIRVGALAERQPWDIAEVPTEVVSQLHPVPGDRAPSEAELVRRPEPPPVPPIHSGVPAPRRRAGRHARHARAS
jgi:hypothetical protein